MKGQAPSAASSAPSDQSRPTVSICAPVRFSGRVAAAKAPAIVKLNPLAEWTEDEVWEYVREREVPTHPLYEQGYTSIGCAPCTRSLAPGETGREGRWWWEENAPKECGVHCAVETGGLEHELHAILGEDA